MIPQWVGVYRDFCAYLESYRYMTNRTINYLSVFQRKWEKKEEIWLSPKTKAHIPTKMSKVQNDNTTNATKKFDYTAIADRLRTVSWNNYSNTTGVVSRSLTLWELPKMDSCLVMTEYLRRRILRLSTSRIDLINSERGSSSTSSFLAQRLVCASLPSMIISQFWCHEIETGSLYFGPLQDL